MDLFNVFSEANAAKSYAHHPRSVAPIPEQIARPLDQRAANNWGHSDTARVRYPHNPAFRVPFFFTSSPGRKPGCSELE